MALILPVLDLLAIQEAHPVLHLAPTSVTNLFSIINIYSSSTSSTFSQQKINLLIVLDQTQGEQEQIQGWWSDWNTIIFTDSPEAIYLVANLRAIVIFMVKLKRTHSTTVTPGIAHLLGPTMTLQKYHHNTVEVL